MMLAIDSAPRVALDTEANSLHNYFDRVCLIQLSYDGRHYIIDPLASYDLLPFVDWLSGRTLILHGADFDLRMLRSTFDFRPEKGVFDTMLAAQLLNYERFGLGALVEEFFDIKLPKGSQKSNWAQRPLRDSQLSYASDDTRYLESIADTLAEQLDALGRLSWHGEWCDRIVDATEFDEPRDPERQWRIKGLGGLSRRQLGFVREVWRWRDREAQSVDRPAFMVMGNQQIVAIAVNADSEPENPLNGNVRLPKTCTGKRLNALKEALFRASAFEEEDWPPLRLKREKHSSYPDTKALVESLKRACSEKASALDLSPSVLAPRAALMVLARNHVSSQEDLFCDTNLMTWQVEEIREIVERILVGSPAS
jgi:ribonuclease D